jgi:hypothetical protein
MKPDIKRMHHVWGVMKTLFVKPKIKLLFFVALSLLTHIQSQAQVRVHANLDGIVSADYVSGGLGIEIEKKVDVDYSTSIGLAYREHVNWKNDDYYVSWRLLEVPLGFKYYIHPALGIQLLVAPRFIVSSPSGFSMHTGHDVAVQTTPGFNTNVGLMVTTGGSFLGLFSLPKMVTMGAGFRFNTLPQSINITDEDSGKYFVKDRGIGFTLKAGITLFTLKRKKL